MLPAENDELDWYADTNEDVYDETFTLSWKLRRYDGDDDLGSVEFHEDDQRWWGFDYTRAGPAPSNCCTFGPFEQLADAQNAVEGSVGNRTLDNRFNTAD